MDQLGTASAEEVLKSDGWESKAQSLQQAVSGAQLAFKGLSEKHSKSSEYKKRHGIMQEATKRYARIGDAVAASAMTKMAELFESAKAFADGGPNGPWLATDQWKLWYSELVKVAESSLLQVDGEKLEVTLQQLQEANCFSSCYWSLVIVLPLC